MNVVKVVEVMAECNDSFEGAVQNGLDKASESIKNIRSAYVNEMHCTVKDGKIDKYRVNLKISFLVE